MSRLDNLINELCPDGVEYSEIKDVCKTITSKIKIKSHDYLKHGLFPVIDQSKNFIGGYTNNKNAFPEDEYIIFGDHTCIVKYVDFAFVQGADGVKILKANWNVINTKYLYYCMSNIYMESGYSRHWTEMKTKKIPVPPLEIQREIVRILDEYSEKVTALQNELEKELELRKKQYSYYRDKLLTFDNDVELKTLSEIAKLSRGIRVVRKQLETTGNIPVYQNSMTPLGYYEKSNCKSNTTFIIGAGAAGEIGFSSVDFWAADDCYYFVCSEKILDRFLYYALLCQYAFIKLQVRKASIPRLARSVIENLKIPVPPIEEQKRIVNILDKFDTLCNDLTSGILAEINAKQKQYEYYRDKLLQFKSL